MMIFQIQDTNQDESPQKYLRTNQKRFNPFTTVGRCQKRLLKLQSNMQLCSSVTS